MKKKRYSLPARENGDFPYHAATISCKLFQAAGFVPYNSCTIKIFLTVYFIRCSSLPY